MPFAHGMNALREAIAGTHGNDYWMYLTEMTAYIGVALLFGLVISIPCKKLNEKIEDFDRPLGIMTIEDGFGRRCLVASSSFYVIKRSSKIQIA